MKCCQQNLPPKTRTIYEQIYEGVCTISLFVWYRDVQDFCVWLLTFSSLWQCPRLQPNALRSSCQTLSPGLPRLYPPVSISAGLGCLISPPQLPTKLATPLRCLILAAHSIVIILPVSPPVCPLISRINHRLTPNIEGERHIASACSTDSNILR